MKIHANGMLEGTPEELAQYMRIKQRDSQINLGVQPLTGSQVLTGATSNLDRKLAQGTRADY